MLSHALQPSQGPRKHNMEAELFGFERVIVAPAEDMRVLPEESRWDGTSAVGTASSSE